MSREKKYDDDDDENENDEDRESWLNRGSWKIYFESQVFDMITKMKLRYSRIVWEQVEK